jgi:NAD(P)H-dependent FMN reductase
MNLLVIVASTRPGRIGDQVGRWVADHAAKTTDFEIRIADLIDFNLPLFDEPGHPRMGSYTKEHTKAWSKAVDAADAFIIVTPEYNYTMPPSLVNAIDYLHHEWAYKPAAFVGYGGASGGFRAIQTARLLISNLKVMPLPAMVALAGVYASSPDAKIAIDEIYNDQADAMLVELKLWAEALQTIRTKKK